MTVKTHCPVCGKDGTAAGEMRGQLEVVPGGEAVEVIDGEDVWLKPHATHASGEVATAMTDFTDSNGAPLYPEG